MISPYGVGNPCYRPPYYPYGAPPYGAVPPYGAPPYGAGGGLGIIIWIIIIIVILYFLFRCFMPHPCP